jgi:beta-fructofuranosidase
MYTVAKANSYILNNKDKVNPRYRLKYHFMPPIGWMNDPNGLVKYKNEYHIFYQFYPYDSVWGPMHWGHAKSIDLIHFNDLDVALAPDLPDETGCFSGGAIIDKDKINLVYTKHFEKDNIKTEEDYLARSIDNVHFEKIGKIFDNERLPKGYSRIDFRDPAPYKINNKYYIFMGAKNEETNQGLIVVLESDTLNDFKYSFTIGPLYELGDMGECPSYKRIDNVDVLVASGCHVEELNNSYKNDNSSVFILGHIDFENKKMDIINIHECDKGDSFYAPQFIQNEEVPTIIGWLEMWGKEIPTQKNGDAWAGAFSIPRILKVENNWVYQKPIDLSKYYEKVDGLKVSKVSHIDCYCKGEFMIKFKAINGFMIIEGNEKSISLDTLNTNNRYPRKRYTNHGYSEVKLEILLDTSSIELFVNDGEFVISSRIYLDSDYEIEVKGNVVFDCNNLKI